MVAQVQMPNRAPTQLDALSTALQLGSTIYNIKYKSEELEQAKLAAAKDAEVQNLQKTLLQEQVAEKQSERSRQEKLAKGELSPLEFGKLVKDSGYAISKTPTEIRVTVGGKEVFLTPREDLSQTKLRAEINKIAAETTKAQREIGQGKPVSPNDISRISEGAAIPKMLDAIEITLGSNKDSFGPIQGLLGKNPYAENQKTIDSQLKTTAQMVGKYMEGGVLRKEDEAKYRDMLPKLTDTPQVAANKLQIVRKMLIDRYNLDVNALEKQGYSTAGLPRFEEGQLPSTLTGNKTSGIISEAQAAPQNKAPVFNPNKPFNVLGK